jgi:hypothetical protein
MLEKGRVCAALATVMLIVCAPVNAQPQQAGEVGANAEENTEVILLLGTGRSNNVFRAPANTRSGSYKYVGLDLDVVRSRPRLNASIAGDMELRDYSISTMENERVGILGGSLELLAVPDRFSWVVNGRTGQGRTNPFQVESPENREDIDIFNTGPRFIFPIGQRTAIRLDATAGTRSFEKTKALDSDTTEVQAGLYRAVSSTTEFGVVVSSREVEYDLSQFDNDVERAYLSYVKQLSTGSATLAVGSNRVDFGDRTESRPYLDLAWEREIGTRSVLTTTLTNRFVDAGDGLEDQLQILDFTAETPEGNILLSQDVYEVSGLFTGLTIEGSRTQFLIGGGISESRYETAFGLDSDDAQLNFGVVRQVSMQLEIGADVFAQRREFKTTAQKDNDKFGEIWLARDFAGPFSVRVGISRNTRSGTNNLSYDEDTVTLSFRYEINPADNL